jgi:post-segregation antitoxin (ccd killing protein)
MKKIILSAVLFSIAHFIFSQTTVIREGIIINNSGTGSWYGDIIARNSPLKLIYRNNAITSVNTEGYMLLAGDEGPAATNNNLDGAAYTGNKLVWNGVNSPSVITHGIFTGYNKNLTIMYNYLENVPYGIILKSGTNEGVNMTFNSGGCAYNICKNGKFAIRLKGMNGVKIYNNTFYNDDNSGWYLVLITSNTDRTIPAVSSNARIYNNIFYSGSSIPMIAIENGSLSSLECDYNVYWCTAGEPYFMVDGKNVSWSQWRAKGFDLHSVICNPNFINSSGLVPANRLNYGKDLGTDWNTGLATTAQWTAGVTPEVTQQIGTWQVGARIYQNIAVQKIVINDNLGTNKVIGLNTSIQLTATTEPANATNKSVQWSVENIDGQATIDSNGKLTSVKKGTIIVTAKATDGSGVEATQSYIIDLSTDNQTEVAVQDFSIYTNSSTGMTQIILEANPNTEATVEIINAQGKILLRRMIKENQTELDLKQYHENILFVKVKSGLFSRTKKTFVKSDI